MPECLPDRPLYIRQQGYQWLGADHQNGPWRPIPAPQAGLPWATDESAVQSREPASVATEARPLSPAAQAVLDAFRPTSHHRRAIAAALRAAADQVVPTEMDLTPNWPDPGHYRQQERRLTRQRFLALAAELEGSNG
jgi:hypothetical protein